MRLGKTTTIHFLSQVVVSVSGFVATLVIARVLGSTVLGEYAVAVALGYFWLAIPGQAIGKAVTKRISEGRSSEKYLSAGVSLNFLVVSLIAVLILVFSDTVNGYIGAEVHYLVFSLAFGSIFFRTVKAGLSGQKKISEVGGLNALERIGRTGGQIALIFIGFGLTGLLIGHTLSLILIGALGIYFYEIGLEIPGKEEFTEILTFSRYAWLGSLKARVFGQMDTLVLALFVSSSLIGIYEVAWGLASLLGMVSDSIKSTLFPEMSELSVDNRHEKIHHYLNEGLVFSGFFVIPGLFGGAVVGRDLLQIYRPEFRMGYVVLLILVGAYLWEVYGAQFISAINAVDRPDVAFRINLVFVSVNLVLNFVLIIYLGWYGAAIATLVSTFLWMSLSYWALSKIIGRPDLPLLEIGYEFVAAAFMAVFILGLDSIVSDGHVTTVILVFGGAFIYVTILGLVSRRIRQKGMSLIRGFIATG